VYIWGVGFKKSFRPCLNCMHVARQVDEVVNDDINVNIVSAKVVAITKAKLQAIAKVVDPVVEIVHEKRRGRPKLAKAALKLDKLQEIENFFYFFFSRL
jgi:hypothetical protein